MTNILRRSILVFATTLLPLAVHASAEMLPAKSLAKFAVEDLTQKPDLLFIAITATGASDESIRAMSKEMQGPPPKLEIKNDRIFVNAQPTEVEITSYAPLNIRYRGRTWVYEKSKAIDQNYFALKKFLDPSRAGASRLNLFIDEAHALGDSPAEAEQLDPGASDRQNRFFRMYNAAALGAGVSPAVFYVVAGLVVGAGGIPMTAVIASAGVGALIGAGANAIYDWYKGKKETSRISNLLAGDFTLTCSAERVELFTRGQSGFQFKHGQFETSVGIYNDEGNKVPRIQITDAHMNVLRSLEKCKTPQQANEMKAQIQTAARQLKAALEKPTDAAPATSVPSKART